MVLKVRAIQRREGLTDAAMAERLGVARSTWTELKNGRLSFNERHQMAATRAFPELLGDLVTSVTVSAPQKPAEAA